MDTETAIATAMKAVIEADTAVAVMVAIVVGTEAVEDSVVAVAVVVAVATTTIMADTVRATVHRPLMALQQQHQTTSHGTMYPRQ